jgi:hypothetical protein
MKDATKVSVTQEHFRILKKNWNQTVMWQLLGSLGYRRILLAEVTGKRQRKVQALLRFMAKKAVQMGRGSDSSNGMTKGHCFAAVGI